MPNRRDLVNRVAERARADGFNVPPPLDANAIETAETQIGFKLPPLLTALYQQVGNGGFGPDYQLFRLVGQDPAQRAVGTYRARRANTAVWRWPEGVLPILDWGCAMNACVDCRHEDAQALVYEPHGCWSIDSPSLAVWPTPRQPGWWNRAEQGELDNLEPWPGARARV